MKLLLTLRKTSDKDFHREFEFTEFPVKLGREEDNDIVLEDSRKIVSRAHARITNGEGVLQISDLGSANFTYLNGERINANEECALKTGDIIKIGDYELEIKIEQTKRAPVFDDQKTMVFSSPFDEDVLKISDAVSKLSEKYFYDESPLKSEMLRISIMQGLGRLVSDDVNKVIAEYFTSKFMDEIPVKKEFASANIHSQEKPAIKPDMHNVQPDLSKDYSFSSHFSDSVDVMLDTVIKLIQGFLHFRQEFFGVTIYHAIPTGSLKEIKEYLFNMDISPDEQRKRIGLIKEETQKLLSHQIGLLEGYRTSVMEGSQALLHSLDPEVIEREAAAKPVSGLENIMPYSKKLKTLDAIKQSYKKYISDPYHLEKKYFRPSFIKGYQKRITAKSEINEY